MSATAAAEWQAARDAEQQRVAEEWEAQADWDALPSCVPVTLPPAHAAPAQPLAGGWHAIDDFPVIDCVLSPCSHIMDVPLPLRVDWARARTEVFDQTYSFAPPLRDRIVKRPRRAKSPVELRDEDVGGCGRWHTPGHCARV